MPTLFQVMDVPPARFERDSMMKITGGLLLILAVSLAGCIRATGPCYGMGCHAFTTPSRGQAPTAASQSAPERTNQTSQTMAGSANTSDAKKSHGIHALLKKVRL
jgi:hypothetical protein